MIASFVTAGGNLKDKRAWSIVLFFLIFTLLFAILSATLGSYPMALRDVISTIWSGQGDNAIRGILLDIRLPRIILALLSGSAMALSGVVLQVLTRNSLAAPGLVGVEAGAGTAVLMAMIVWRSALPIELYPLAAFLGGVLVAFLIAALSWNRGISPLRLILVGVGVTAILSAVADTLITYGRIDQVESALLWLAGSLHSAGWENVRSQSLWLILSGVPILLLHRHFDLFQLGGPVASTRGLNIGRFQIAVLLFSVMLTASAVANVGTMSFIGLLAPHAARLLVGDRHRFLLPLTAILGASIVLISDTIGRTAFAPLQIPAGLVVAVIGAPYLLFLLSRRGQS
ncbi:iron ABC transporter permease [Agrobacterium larrymoorei]|uniref:FecCD family ABC transporter permease n=1 Tax=Agrobacterium larrymoorei TaxID=160699 RepID=UPI00157340BA|nr:iron ABC transporter permease [Agrobacterium larrymoorei]NTJ44699.1 iron ABC transporter permease [Agrobacterium larrymoorei]